MKEIPAEVKEQVEKESEAIVEDELGTTIYSKPQVINDPNCKHHYVDYDLDDEGYMNARCIKCPMGIRYLPEESELKDGKIITR